MIQLTEYTARREVCGVNGGFQGQQISFETLVVEATLFCLWGSCVPVFTGHRGQPHSSIRPARVQPRNWPAIHSPAHDNLGSTTMPAPRKAGECRIEQLAVHAPVRAVNHAMGLGKYYVSADLLLRQVRGLGQHCWCRTGVPGPSSIQSPLSAACLSQH